MNKNPEVSESALSLPCILPQL